MCTSARNDDAMRERENGKDVHTRVWLVTMCVCLKAWCKMHGRTNNNGEGTDKETPDISNVEGLGVSTNGKRSPPRDREGRSSVWGESQHEVLRMHARWFKKKYRGDNQNWNQEKKANNKGKSRRRRRHGHTKHG